MRLPCPAGIVLSLLCLFSAVTSAQPAAMPAQQRVVDSLSQALATARNDSARTVILKNIGLIYLRHSNLKEGRRYLEQAMRTARDAGDDDATYNILQHIAVSHEVEGAHALGLELLLRCLKYHERKQHSREVSMLHLNIGNLYFRMEAYREAIGQHKKAISRFEPLGTSYVLGRAYFSLGSDYLRIGRLDSAEQFFMKAMKVSQVVKDDEAVALACDQMGLLCLKQGRHREAGQYFQRVLAITARIDAPNAAASAYRGIGLVSAAAGNYDEAAQQLTRAAEIARANGLRNILAEVLPDLAAVHEKRQDFLSAYRVAVRYTALRDTMLATQNRRQMNELLVQYEAEQHEQQILLLEKDRIIKDEVLTGKIFQRNAAIGGLVLLAVVSVLLVRNLRLRRRESEARAAAAELRAEAAQNESLRVRTEGAEREREAQRRFSAELIRAQEEERQRIASDLHDSLAQKLVVIQNRAALALRQDGGSEHATQQLLHIASVAVDTIAEVRAISRSLSPQLLKRFGLSAALRNLVVEMESATGIAWTTDIEDIAGVLSPHQEINLYRIVQEGANNIVRHSRATAGSLVVRRTGGALRVRLSDNGTGFDLAATEAATTVSNGLHGDAQGTETSGMGLHSMRRRADLLSAKLRIDSRTGDGTDITLEIPVLDTDTISVFNA
jgi:signal transduction histidine kinase